jgi:multidrug resistance efflux pump
MRAQTAQTLAKRHLDRWQRLERDSAVSAEVLDEHQSAYDDASAVTFADGGRIVKAAVMRTSSSLDARPALRRCATDSQSIRMTWSRGSRCSSSATSTARTSSALTHCETIVRHRAFLH